MTASLLDDTNSFWDVLQYTVPAMQLDSSEVSHSHSDSEALAATVPTTISSTLPKTVNCDKDQSLFKASSLVAIDEEEFMHSMLPQSYELSPTVAHRPEQSAAKLKEEKHSRYSSENSMLPFMSHMQGESYDHQKDFLSSSLNAAEKLAVESFEVLPSTTAGAVVPVAALGTQRRPEFTGEPRVDSAIPSRVLNSGYINQEPSYSVTVSTFNKAKHAQSGYFPPAVSSRNVPDDIHESHSKSRKRQEKPLTSESIKGRDARLSIAVDDDKEYSIKDINYDHESHVRKFVPSKSTPLRGNSVNGRIGENLPNNIDNINQIRHVFTRTGGARSSNIYNHPTSATMQARSDPIDRQALLSSNLKTPRMLVTPFHSEEPKDIQNTYFGQFFENGMPSEVLRISPSLKASDLQTRLLKEALKSNYASLVGIQSPVPLHSRVNDLGTASPSKRSTASYLMRRDKQLQTMHRKTERQDADSEHTRQKPEIPYPVESELKPVLLHSLTTFFSRTRDLVSTPLAMQHSSSGGGLKKDALIRNTENDLEQSSDLVIDVSDLQKSFGDIALSLFHKLTKSFLGYVGTRQGENESKNINGVTDGVHKKDPATTSNSHSKMREDQVLPTKGSLSSNINHKYNNLDHFIPSKYFGTRPSSGISHRNSKVVASAVHQAPINTSVLSKDKGILSHNNRFPTSSRKYDSGHGLKSRRRNQFSKAGNIVRPALSSYIPARSTMQLSPRENECSYRKY